MCSKVSVAMWLGRREESEVVWLIPINFAEAMLEVCFLFYHHLAFVTLLGQAA